MTLSLSKLQECAEKAISKRRPSIATMESLAFHQALYPEDVLALIRVARAAKDMIGVTEQKWLTAERWDEIVDIMKEISE